VEPDSVRSSRGKPCVLFGCGLVLVWSVAGARAQPRAAQSDQGAPGTTVSAAPTDPLAPPFVCLLPDYWPATNNPQWFVRWAQTDEAEGWRLAPFTTPSGIHVLRIPDAPLTEPGPDLIGAYHKPGAERVLRLLYALSAEQRDLLARGEVVNITNARDTVAEIVPRDRTGDGTDAFGDGTLTSCEYMAAALAVVPTVEVRPGGRDTGALCDVDICYSHEPGRIMDLQLRPDGLTFWSALTAPGSPRERDPSEWKVLPWHLRAPSRDVTAATLPDVLKGLEDGQNSASLDDINGAKLGALVGDIADLSGVELRAADECSSRVVYAQGGDVSTRALAEALFASGRLAITSRKPDGALVVTENRGEAWAASIELAELARRRMIPALTAELRSLLEPALARPYLAGLPVPLLLFLDGYDGPVSGLLKPEVEWMEGMLREVEGIYANLPAFDRAWLSEGEPLAVRLRLQLQLTVAACFPYRKFDPATRTYCPADPPQWYYTVLGASLERPILSTVVLQYRAY